MLSLPGGFNPASLREPGGVWRQAGLMSPPSPTSVVGPPYVPIPPPPALRAHPCGMMLAEGSEVLDIQEYR